MSPPTEQLIRDYLNRLSVAARGQLGPEDRRALMARTRDFIERKTGLAGPPTAVEVARLLSGLGDPAGLVSQEVRRLAAVRGEPPPEPVSKTSFLARLRRDPSAPASWHWPSQAGSRSDLQLRLLDAAIPDGGGPDGGDGPDSGDGSDSAGEPDGQDRTKGHDNAGGPDGRDAQQRTKGHGSGDGQAGGERQDSASGQHGDTERQAAVSEPESGPADRGGRSLAASASAGSQGRQDRPVPAGAQLTSPAAPAVFEPAQPDNEHKPPPRLTIVPVPAEPEPETASQPAADEVAGRYQQRAALWARAVGGWVRDMPLEAAAVVLLGLGGGLYPPVWLLGAIVALTSGVWDYRDKWVGLAGPLLLTVIGIALGLGAAGNQGSLAHHIHVGWVVAVAVSRAAAALGAAYLAWRSVRDRKSPEIPPWNKPRKVG